MLWETMGNVFNLNGVQVVAGSNPVAPTRKIKHLAAMLSAFLVSTVWFLYSKNWFDIFFCIEKAESVMMAPLLSSGLLISVLFLKYSENQPWPRTHRVMHC